jgi:hypothetical protein
VVFYIGSFAGGLFNGASSAMSIYNAYQGIQKNQYDLDAAEKAKQTYADQERDKGISDTVGGLRTQLGYTPGGVDDPAMKPYQPTPTTTTTSGPVRTPASGGTGGDDPWHMKKPGEEPKKDEGSVGGKGEGKDDKQPLPPLAADIDRVPRLMSPGIVRASEPALGAQAVPGTTPPPMTSAGGGVDEYGRQMRPFQLTPSAFPPASPPPPPEARPVAPVVTAPSGLQTYDQQFGPPAPPPPQQFGPPAPPVPSALQRPSQITNAPVGSTITYPGQVKTEQAGPPAPPQPRPYTPDMPTDNRGHYYDQGTQQWLPIPTSALQRPSAITNAPVGSTITPPGGTPLQQPPAPAPAPPAPPPTAGGAPAAGQGRGVGSTILGALGVGTAQAGELPPGTDTNDPTLFTQIATPTLDPKTGDVKSLTPAPNAPPKVSQGGGAPRAVERSPESAPAQPGNAIAMGDSLGVGMGRVLGTGDKYATGGLGPRAVLKNIENTPNDAIAGKDVFLSSGASNGPADVGYVTGQIEALRSKGARSITLIGVGDAQRYVDNRTNQSLQAIANQTGVPFRPLNTKQLSDDRIHLSPAGYRELVGSERGIDPVSGQSKPATPASPDQAHADTPPAQQPPPPVPVQGSGSVGGGDKGGEVALGQKGDSEQSQATTTAYAPPVNPSPWQYLQKNDPEGAQWVLDAIKAEGGSSVTPDQLAAHWMNESHFGRTSPNSYAGAMGPMQFMPATYKTMDPNGQYDVNKAPDALKLAARYLKHLAVDEHLGAGSFMTNYAYWRGPGAARALQADFDGTLRAQPAEVAANIERFYPGMKLSKDLAPGDGGGQSYRDNYPAVVQAQTPDQILNIVATTGPTGMGMTDRWKQLEGAMVAAAIAHGNYDAVGHVTDWIAQMSHQGAVSNLASAYTMLQMGNTQGAAGALARAHAFFPDGTYGRFGVSANGTLLAQQFDEKTGLALGKPFLINQDHIAHQMLQLQNPRTYLDAVQKYEKTNAEIALNNAHAQYFRESPDLKREAIDAKRAQQQEHDAAVTQRQIDAARAKAEVAAAKDEANTTEEGKANTAVNSDYNKRMEDARANVDAARTANDPDALKKAQDEADRLGRESQISRDLRIGIPHGGYGMAGPAADRLAEGMTQGRYDMIPLTAQDGSKHVGIYDKGTKREDVDAGKAPPPHAVVSVQRGTRIQYLTGAVPVPTPGGAQPQAAKTTVGAGLNDPRTVGQFTTNFAGITPTSHMPAYQAGA